MRWAWLLLALCLAACSGLAGEPVISATLPPPTVRPAASASGAWQPNIENGGRIFAERCVECHGESGAGQGTLVANGSIPPPIDMTDGAVAAAKSPLEWYEIITKGNIANLMPPWENALSTQERWDVALYAYTLQYDEALLAAGERLWQGCADCALPAAIPPILSDLEYGAQLNATFFDAALTDADRAAAAAYARMRSLQAGDTAAPAVPLVDFSGRLQHGSAGANVPADTVVQLQYGNSEIGFALAETTIAEDLTFTFEGIPLSAAFTYTVGAVYGQRLFSQVLPAENLVEARPALMLYDATHDPAVISVAHIELFIEPIKLADLGAGFLVSQRISHRNASDRMYTSGRGFDDGREAVLLLQFPSGARVLSGDDSGRYVLIEDMAPLPNSLLDTQPVLPGTAQQSWLEYFLPYANELQFEQAFNNALDAEVRITLAGALTIDSDFLRLVEEAPADNLRVYAGALKMERAPRLSFLISGAPFSPSSANSALVTSDVFPALLLGGTALAAISLAGWRWTRRRQNPAGQIEALVKELARLDEAHEQGQLNHDLWHQQRRVVKAKLAELMEAES